MAGYCGTAAWRATDTRWSLLKGPSMSASTLHTSHHRHAGKTIAPCRRGLRKEQEEVRR